MPNPSGAPRHLPYPRYRAAEEDIATLQPHIQTAQRVCTTSQFHLPYSQPQTLNHRLLPANVFPCVAASARYRGSGSIEPKGLTVSRKAAFGEVESRKVCETATLILSEPLRFLRKHLPYPRYRAAEEDIACLHDFTVSLALLSTTNSQP